MDDTTGKGSRGNLPAEALEVERIVGLFDVEMAGGEHWTCEQFNEHSPRRLTEADIQKVRASFGTISEMVFGSSPGHKLELSFS